jgi:para-nitrobenzyl esterase
VAVIVAFLSQPSPDHSRARRITPKAPALWLLLLHLCSPIAASYADDPSPGARVSIGAGTLEGVADARMESYLGIPYAKPPVGALRWQPAQPVDGLEGTFDASAFGPICMQPDRPQLADMEMSENCLTLNVWKPTEVDAPAPVMV